MTRIIYCLITCLLLVSCYNQSPEESRQVGKHTIHEDAYTFEEEMEIDQQRTSKPPPPPPSELQLEKGSKIIKNGFMRFEVSGLESAKAKVDSVLTYFKGYYENEQFDSFGARNTYSLLLRIPSVKFDSLVTSIESGVGELNSKNINSRDVTEEYLDLNIRLDNNLAYLAQYKEILRKAKTVEEILEVQERIRRIEEEIDSKKGRLKYLDDKVEFSVLKLELTELIETEIATTPKFLIRLGNAFNSGFQSFINFIVGFVSVWPFVILFLFLIIGRKSILKKVKWRMPFK